jgi:hypothetical protein
MQGMGRGGGLLQLATRLDVQAELKLDDATKGKIATLQEQQREKRREQFQNMRDMSPEERTKMMQKFQEQEAKDLGGILSADQMKRLKQIHYQQIGAQAFNEKDVQEALGFTAEQKTQLQKIQDAQQNAMQDLMEEMRGGGGPPDREAMATKFREHNEKYNKGRLAILTDDQKKKWEEMQGPKFNFKDTGGGG